eukprot:3031407-Prymnesium_polylepis.1
MLVSLCLVASPGLLQSSASRLIKTPAMHAEELASRGFTVLPPDGLDAETLAAAKRAVRAELEDLHESVHTLGIDPLEQ